VLKEKFENAREQLSHMDALPDLYEAAKDEIQQLKEELAAARAEISKFTDQNKVLTTKNSALTSSLMETKAELARYVELERKVSAENAKLSAENATSKDRLETLEKATATLSSENVRFKEQLFQANIERKNLHNQVLDLRGNIRVFCRIRRPISSEMDRQLAQLGYLDEQTIEMNNSDVLNKGAKQRHEFSFDQVFHSETRQEDIFEMVSPLIQSALDGYNVCIFAYGQTGSGKTYTMDGIDGAEGVIPRTVHLIFNAIEDYKRMGWTYECSASFLEIYNEVLYDLLSNENKEMEIRMANAKNKTEIYVSNLTEERVETTDYLLELIEIARLNRATAATVSNERSSRSHAVTRIQLVGHHKEKNETSIGTINLVDLAGSESPKTSVRMDETKNINRSLSELSNVILALVQRQDHIPYRNSKLTHLLMPSLGGNSKTLMFVNVAPFQDCFVESVKSLRFASSVNSCKTQKAKRNKFLNAPNNSMTT
jgi:kinesin family member C1